MRLKTIKKKDLNMAQLNTIVQAYVEKYPGVKIKDISFEKINSKIIVYINGTYKHKEFSTIITNAKTEELVYGNV